MKLCVISLTLFIISCMAAPSPPTWPAKFTASGVIRLPYGYGINQPFNIVFDSTANKAVIDYFNGMDTYLSRGDLQTDYMVIPRINTLTCFSNPQSQGETLQTVLPDISTWTYNGQFTVRDQACYAFQQKVTNLNKTATYTFYVTQNTNVPVRLILQGYDFLFGSHPDLYMVDYDTYQPNQVDESKFDVPALCNSSSTHEGLTARTRAMFGLLHYITTPQQIDNEFDHFSVQHKKNYSPSEYEQRKLVWSQNTKFIHNHNSQTKTFTTKMNHFGDLSWDEFKSFMLPRSGRKQAASLINTASMTHPEPTQEQMAALPASIDWRELNAVTMVKDQGICGSCWTFGSIGSLEGVWAVNTGVLIPLSEQQIVDCAWGDWANGISDSGCDGGFAGPAFQWMINNGGVALEDEYRYMMVDSYCHADRKSSGVVVKGYVNVTSGSEAALQHAVATMGPVAVAIDAAHPEFEYYDSGVYYNPQCKNDANDLDHEVLVVGYGTDPVGGDYWIVKNSWSTYWGEHGFIRMARNRGNNCGIATQANYPLV